MKVKGWNKLQIEQHGKAAKNLCDIKDRVFDLMGKQPEISEFEVAQFILDQFKQRDMKTDPDMSIVAFRENTSFVHYFPTAESAKTLKPNSLIMLDVWARMNEKGAPFADITWMAWSGEEIPEEIQKAFDAVILSRDRGVEYIKTTKIKNLKTRDISRSMTGITLKSGVQDFIPHGFGHSLGTTTCHGNGVRLKDGSRGFLPKNIAYTIEPGIYVEGKFGVRSEIDFYVNENGKLNITTEIQKTMLRI